MSTCSSRPSKANGLSSDISVEEKKKSKKVVKIPHEQKKAYLNLFFV